MTNQVFYGSVKYIYIIKMGWFKESMKCLSACSIRFKCKSKCCVKGCCISDCMLEETANELSKQSSSTSEESKIEKGKTSAI